MRFVVIFDDSTEMTEVRNRLPKLLRLLSSGSTSFWMWSQRSSIN